VKLGLQVAATVRSCNYHLQALRSLRNSLPRDIAVNIACIIIGSRLDYCNVIYFGNSEANFHKLQRIQTVQHVLFVMCRFDSNIQPTYCVSYTGCQCAVASTLNWLCSYKAYKLQQPSYLADLLSYQQPRDLRSTGLGLLSTEASSTTIGARMFSCVAPAIWNTLPISVRSADSLTCFRSRLKTCLFSRHV